MSGDIHDRTLALAGIFQATELVQRVARTGMSDSAALAASIGSIFQTNAGTSAEVYGGVSGVRTGLKLMTRYLATGSHAGDLEVLRYSIGVVQLARRLLRNPKLLNTLSEGIEQATRQAEHYSVTHANVLAALAALYERTLSTLTPRIMVNGERVYLANQDNVHKIRALLLAAVRSAVLWQQKGGSRLSLLWSRRRYLRCAEALLAESASP